MNKDDIEFYEAGLVLTAARSMLKPREDWDTLSYRRKQVLLDRSVGMLHALLNNPEALRRLAWISARSNGGAPDCAGSVAGDQGNEPTVQAFY